MKKFKDPKCKICWDKGYASQLVANSTADDFFGDRIHSHAVEVKNYCRCAKGRRMKKAAEKKSRVTKNSN